METIPWISHHPLDVKRGTFVGGLSRLAGLSSMPQTYTEAVRDLVALYIKRGYPAQIINAWTSKYFEERWQKRHAPKKDDDNEDARQGVLVLKSHYNLAWNYLKAKELGDTMLGYWRE